MPAARGVPARLPHTPAAPAEPDAFDVCKNNVFRAPREGLRATPEAIALAARGARARRRCRASARGSARCRAFAPRSGRSSASPAPIDCAVINGGYIPEVTANGAIGGADLSVRAGLGLDGVIGESGDGLVFGSLGVRGDTPSTNNAARRRRRRWTRPAARPRSGRASASPPALRMPFYLIPGDLLLLVAAVPLLARDLHRHGGHRQQRRADSLAGGWATRIGRFQFVLGRELGATFYGYGFENTTVVPSATPGAERARRRFQVDPFRPADPRIPALPGVRHQAELSGADPALCRCRGPEAHHGDLAAGGAGGEVRDDLLDRVAVHLRLAALFLIVGPGGH